MVLGVDTHKDIHVAAVLNTIGGMLGSATFPTTAAGYRQLLAWARGFGTLRRAGVECTGSYGKALSRHLRAEHVEVTEVNSPDKATRRRRGKTDAIDAEAAARAVLSGRATTAAKTGDGPVEMARMFKLAKASAIKSRTQAVNQLKAILVSCDPALRESLAGLSNKALVRRCAAFAAAAPTDASTAAVYALRLLAQRIQHLSAEIRDLEAQIGAVVAAYVPKLVERVGVGDDSAAALLIAAGDNPERLNSQASFAATASATSDPAGAGSNGSASSVHSSAVNASRSGPARVRKRRSQPRTVDAERPNRSATRRCPQPSTARTSAAPITATVSARRTNTPTGSNTCVHP
jgi:transposase